MPEVLPDNGLQSTLSSSINDSAATIPIQITDSGAWPATGEYRAVLWQDALNGPWEVVRVTSGQGTSNLGVLRAAEPFRGTQLARSWPGGTGIAAVLTQDALDARFYVALYADEFVPGFGVAAVTLVRAPEKIVMIARNGVVQSQGAGHYTVAGSIVTFAASFSGTERIIVSYSARGGT